MLRAALVGAGGMSGAHSNAYLKLEGAKITSVADTDREAAEIPGTLLKHGAQGRFWCTIIVLGSKDDIW